MKEIVLWSNLDSRKHLNLAFSPTFPPDLSDNVLKSLSLASSPLSRLWTGEELTFSSKSCANCEEKRSLLPSSPKKR